MRNLKEHNYITLGQQKISVQVEIGDKKLEPNIMEKCDSNGNFIFTHRKEYIVIFAFKIKVYIRKSVKF